MKTALLAAALASAAALHGAAAWPAAPGQERPVQPDRFMLSVAGGAWLASPPARIDIRHGHAGAAPAVDISFTASDAQGNSWSVVVWAPAGFLDTRALQARVSGHPLRTGQASVQHAGPAGAVVLAQGGTLELVLRQGRLTGHAAGRGVGTLRFEGPVAVSCTVPDSGSAAAAPAAVAAVQAQRVDDRFESEQCKPYAALAHSS